MDIHFNNLSFSIFDYASFDDIKGLVKELFKDDFCNSTTEFLPHPFSLDSFMPQHVGGDHDNLFGFWKSKRYHSKLFFISNSADGRATLCNVIHQTLKCAYTMCSLSDETVEPLYLFKYATASLEDRVVIAYKEDKWVFYEVGERLPIENPDFYKQRRANQRLNNAIVLSYLEKMGITLDDIDKDVTDYFICNRKISKN
ncbi:hypothetical protein [Prevotella sp.]